MPENIVKKIKKAELEAGKTIEDAKKRAIALVNKSKEKAEEEAKAFEAGSIERLKKFREEKESFYNTEAEKIKTNGLEARANYIKEIEKKLPTIKEKVSELIRKELCL